VQEGIGYHQATIRDGRRCSTAVAYLQPARSRPNLRVVTDAVAAKVRVEGKRAVGVAWTRHGAADAARAGGAVILCGGAFGSPQLLELSGIGRPEVLRRAGIAVVHELPGVGHDLQDHQIVRMRWRILKPVTYNDEVRGWRGARSLLRYALGRGGILSMPTLPISAFVRTRPELASPDVQFQVFPGTFADFEARILDREPGVTMGVTLLRPESRGTVHVKTADPSVQPAIVHNLLSTEGDRQTVLSAMKLCRRLMAAPAMAGLTGAEFGPLAGIDGDDALLAAACDTVQSNWHPASSCRMGADKLAVVDARLRVHGLEGLRVADASIMPTVISGNTNAATIMIGEKAADMILEDAKAA
jgi:choline dehydrogenase-like flavoprotein